MGEELIEADVVVVGGGNAALCAGLTARESGASVVVLESAPFVFRGGNSRHTRNMRCMHDGPAHGLTGTYAEDEYFGKDIGFFVFDYPWFRFLASYGFALLIVAMILTALVYYLYGAISFQARVRKVSTPARIHLSIMIGIFMLLKAFARGACSVPVTRRSRRSASSPTRPSSRSPRSCRRRRPRSRGYRASVRRR